MCIIMTEYARAHMHGLGERLRCALRGEGVLPCATAAILARQHLCDCGFDAPEWSASPAPRSDNPAVLRDRWPFKGWQPSARTRCTFLTLHLLLERCCCPKLGLSPPVPLMSHPRGMTSPYPAPCLVFSCCAACGFPSRSRRADAAVAPRCLCRLWGPACPPGPCR